MRLPAPWPYVVARLILGGRNDTVVSKLVAAPLPLPQDRPARTRGTRADRQERKMDRETHDRNLMTFDVSYYDREGNARRAFVPGHNDGFDEDERGHYRVWRYIETGELVTAFRVRPDQWEATATAPGLPPTAEELEAAKIIQLEKRNGSLQEELHVARANASALESAFIEAQEDLASARAELNKLLPSAAAPPPEMDDVPF
jgi:hypothetical protein